MSRETGCSRTREGSSDADRGPPQRWRPARLHGCEGDVARRDDFELAAALAVADLGAGA
ncbi:hypothetical protein SAMN02745121_01405 [Nannocystis exedens]|uniref:Uncharacterized protein n=1 Tax=Nannocystis exedens TaxID=54 RepID=A0A1I1V3W7_9BACT|nr:hypothetical protein NAEX_05275 [Nannocystis exedens]SFD75783.1 hypothetical protein SAMN02745121_01405 [Nannocystis exedens]